MMYLQLLAALLLVVGGAIVLFNSQIRRPDLRRRMRLLRGIEPPSRRQVRSAVLAVLTVLAVLAVPVVVALVGAPSVVVVLVVLAIMPMVVSIGVELHAVIRRSGMPPRVPLTAQWQQRLAGRLAARMIAPFPAPPLRHRRPRVRSRPLPLTSAGSGRRLLVVPPGTAPVRVWDLAESYLGSRGRYRDVLSLNTGRRSPNGALINEDSRIGAGWSLLMPRDATGTGLVDLPGDPRIHPMPAAYTASGQEAAPEPAPAQQEQFVPEPVVERAVSERAVSEATAPRPVGPQPTASQPVGPQPTASQPVGPQPMGPRPTRPEQFDVRAPGPSAPVEQQVVTDEVAAQQVATEPVAADQGGTRQVPAEQVQEVEQVVLRKTPAQEVEEPAPLEHPPADLPWDLVHAQMLADGVRTAMRFRRAQREHDRPFGATVPPLDPGAAAVHAAAAIGADRSGAQFLDHAVRLLGDTPPIVRAARLTADAVEFALATPDAQPPEPFVADDEGRRWILPLATAAETPRRTGGGLPGLVSLGRDRSGWVLADVLAAGGPVAVLGDPRAGRLVAMAIGLELATKRWSDDLRVTMVGFGLNPPTLDHRLRVADRLEEVGDDLVRRLLEGHGEDGGPAVPEFLVLAEPPPAPQYELLRHLAASNTQARLGLLVVGASRHDRWRLELDGQGVLHCRELGLAVGAQALSVATASSLGDLVAAESGSLLPEPRSGGRVPWPELPREVDPTVTEVVVRLFGEPRLDGPQGPLEADPITVEIIAFLALMGAATPEEIAAAVFPFGVAEADLRMALKVVTEVLETAPSGNPGLLEYDDGQLELTEDVHADWHLFVELGSRGLERAALELLTAGPPPGPEVHEEDGYGWLPAVPLSRLLPAVVADTAHEEAARSLEAGRPDLAAVAASAGLRVLPLSQLLRRDLEGALGALRPDSPLRVVGA